jgi:hypothetical protein
LLLALERRRIAHPRLRANYIRDLRQAKWGSTVSLHGSDPKLPMSALGQKQTFRGAMCMSAPLPKGGH